jgi:hypothetical protein
MQHTDSWRMAVRTPCTETQIYAVFCVLTSGDVYSSALCIVRVGNCRQKNNSAEDGIDGTNGGYFRREFRLFRGTKTSRNSVPNPFSEVKTARNSVPWNKNRSRLSECLSEPFNGRENILEQRKAGYKKTGLGELRRMKECMILLCDWLLKIINRMAPALSKNVLNLMELPKA